MRFGKKGKHCAWADPDGQWSNYGGPGRACPPPESRNGPSEASDLRVLGGRLMARRGSRGGNPGHALPPTRLKRIFFHPAFL